ncbi:hypothetical protein TNCV_5139061 [Trichonephila clavipes]|nr:hypothetical protein TNCV_5139061 [Trichonephila clavipes]
MSTKYFLQNGLITAVQSSEMWARARYRSRHFSIKLRGPLSKVVVLLYSATIIQKKDQPHLVHSEERLFRSPENIGTHIFFATAVEKNVQQTVAAAMTIVTTCCFTFRSHPPLSRKPRLSIYTGDVLVTSSTVMLRTLKNGVPSLGNHSFRNQDCRRCRRLQAVVDGRRQCRVELFRSYWRVELFRSCCRVELFVTAAELSCFLLLSCFVRVAELSCFLLLS